jgi:nifR3 family TIM-barrel protein
MSTWKIRDLILKNQVVIAPMAGVSNPAFRSILTQYEPGLIYSEMISDKAIVYRNQRTLEMTQVFPDEHPIALQLFGEDVESMVQAAIYLDTQTACDIIDINMGCPVPKIVKGSGGASLLKDPDKAFAIARAVKAAIQKPLTVKIRTGWDAQHINAIEMAKGLERAGVDALAVHGRTRAAMYSGSVDYEIIRQVKAAVSMPVIANGDIRTPVEARHVLALTQADAIMVGRAVLGKPWVAKELVDGLDGRASLPTDIPTRFAMARLHAQKLIELRGEVIAMKEMRTHFSWYMTGLPHSHRVRNDISQMTSLDQFDKIITDYLISLENGAA